MTKVENSANNSLDWTEVGVTTACKANDLAAHSILLVGESKGGKSGLLDLFNGGCSDVDSCVPNKRMDVFKTEWGLLILGVLSRSQ